jgi:hypothetical protein
MHKIECPKCFSENSINSTKCNNCQEDFTKYNKIGTSEAFQLVLPEKISSRKVRKADRVRAPWIFAIISIYIIVLIVIFILAKGEVICEGSACIAPVYFSGILLLSSMSLIFFFVVPRFCRR